MGEGSQGTEEGDCGDVMCGVVWWDVQMKKPAVTHRLHQPVCTEGQECK